jgi:magnesium chelatase family protein
MNPCRCGLANEPGYACNRQPNERCIAQYHARLSGPLLDRIDLHIEVPAISAADLMLPVPSEGSEQVAGRVARAREIQRRRYSELGRPEIGSNAAAPADLIETVAKLDAKGLALMRDAAERLQLSARGFHRVLKLARTIADLDEQPAIGSLHITEALSYRALAARKLRAA